jgi:hypothetical protein
LVDVGGERGAGGDFDVFAVLDEADGTEENGERDGGSGFALSFTAFCAAPPALDFLLLHFPALTGWAKFWRTFGARRRTCRCSQPRIKNVRVPADDTFWGETWRTQRFEEKTRTLKTEGCGTHEKRADPSPRKNRGDSG